MSKERKPHLLLLNHPSPEAALYAWQLCRELNIPVPVQNGHTAFEVLATPDEVETLIRHGLFAAQSARKFSKEHLEKLSPAAREIVDSWNQRFAPEYQKRKKDLSKRGLPYNAPGKEEPAPYVDIDVPRFRKKLEEQLKRRKIERAKIKPELKLSAKRMTPEVYLQVKKYIAERVADEKISYQLGKLFYHLEPEEWSVFLSPEILEIIAGIYKEMKDYGDAGDGGAGGGGGSGSAGPETSCWRMHGRNSVGVVFVESSKSGGPKFSTTTRNEILAEIKAGLSFLVSQHPSNNLSWVFDVQKVTIDVANKANKSKLDSSYDAYWREPGMGKVVFNGNTYAADDDAIDQYREDMRQEHNSQHAIAIFVSPYGSSWHAYSSGKRFISLTEHGNDWGGWGQDELNITTAHEMCHKFGAADEYSGSGTPCDSCGGSHGCDNIPNGNCESCAEPPQGCIMQDHDLRICQHTRGQIGWSDIFVELFTDDVLYAGTDDTVRLDIGNRTFNLDVPGHDDREKGNREGYAIWDGGNLALSSIKRILIRKSSDGSLGGWKLKRVRVFHKGSVICDKSPNKWLEDNTLWFLGCVFDNTLVNKLTLKVTTADVSLAGTDDDVTLKLAGHSWNLDNSGNDFERGDTNTFNLDPKTGIRVSDLHTITITKSSDGAFGGWKLKGLELIVNDVTIYKNMSINKWLEDDDRIFTDEI